MKAVVWHGIGGIRLDEVPEPVIEQPTDAQFVISSAQSMGAGRVFAIDAIPSRLDIARRRGPKPSTSTTKTRWKR